MRLLYEENPHPTLKLKDDQFDVTIKSLGVSGIDAANIIADAVAKGTIKSGDLMAPSIATGADAIKLIDGINIMRIPI